MTTKATLSRLRQALFLLCPVLLLCSFGARAQLSSNVTITPITTPALTPCSGQGTFVVRISNIGSSAVSGLTLRDSMPPGINYVAGSASGTGVTFGSTIIASNVVTFNIASIPSSGFVDVSFAVAVNCSVSTSSANIKNTYKVNWGTFFTDPYITPTYPLSFPSLSISVDSPSLSKVCGTPFTRKITICNGGFGPIDSLTLSDVEGNAGLTIVNFNKGTVTGTNTNNAKTVLKAADFVTVGNMDGKLDQGECIVVTDTLVGVTTASPVTGTITANWGCFGATCTNATPNNSFVVSTVMSSSGQVPALTRVSFTQNTNDSSGQIFNRTTTYREVIRNNSTATANNSVVRYIAKGLKYIDTSTVKASKNGGPLYTPPITIGAGPSYTTPNTGMANILAPASYPGSSSPSAITVNLGSLAPGDSIVITFSARTAGPVTRVSDYSYSNNNGNFYFGGCGNYYYSTDGPSLGTVVDPYLTWQGSPCSAGNYFLCQAIPTGLIFDGVGNVTESGPASIYLSRFRNFGFVDSTFIAAGSPPCQTYHDQDTVKLLMTAGVTDLPFYTDKSKFYIKVYTNGGVQWDGNISKVYGRLNSWSASPWYPSSVVDNSAVDSTIEIHFSRSNCPVTANFSSDPYNSYRGGSFQLYMQFKNLCPGANTKQLFMTRVYRIDTTSSDPAVEAGPAPGNFKFSWSSTCPIACNEGVQTLDYSRARINFGAPDNNNDGEADASGALNMSVVQSSRVTWGDTLRFKYKMLIKTVQPGGVPYLYLNSTINGSSTANNTICNNIMKKGFTQVKLIRPGSGTFTGTTASIPVNDSNAFQSNLSLQGGGGVTLPGITTYQNGDTVEVTQDLVYWTPHEGWGLTTWNMNHIPYTSTVSNPTGPQQFKCDSIICGGDFQTIDFSLSSSSSLLSAGSCSDSLVLRTNLFAQTVSAGCGSTFFPGEARSIVTPSVFKMRIPGWTVQRINVYYSKKINGTGNCSNIVNNQLLPANLYSISGDTLIINLVQVGQFYGQDITVNQLRSGFTFDCSLRYNSPASQQGCGKDHADIATNFSIWGRFSPAVALDSATMISKGFSTTTYDINGGPLNTVNLNWPGPNNNSIAFPGASVVSVTQPNVAITIRYAKGPSGIYGNDFIAIPNRPGITVDSVKDNVTGAVLSAAGNIYNVAYLPPNTSRDYTVFTRVSACNNDTLFMYADRTPCSGMPATWAGYNCKANANSAGFRYLTFAGELQMQDSLYSTLKDICTTDTVQFNVYNSQTQDAHGIKINFTLPAAMSLVPGQTQLKMANGSFVTVTDPVLTGGTYTWSLPASDTLRNINMAPANSMILRCGIATSCGYVSGSQITSSIQGNVACGPITSLFNTNPLPLAINGAPSLSYFTNVEATAAPITGCSATPGYDYRIAMHISGGTTGSSDKVNVTLPAGYTFVSYNPSASGSVHAPVGAPTSTVLANGSTQLSWTMPAAITGGDSIIFTFKYNEVSTATNKCGASPLRNSIVNTLITTSVFCSTIGANCTAAIGNGADTVNLQSLKPNITTTTNTVVYGDAANAVIPGTKSYLYISGTLQNTGTAAVAPGTAIIMEPFMDLDNSGTITPGDYAFTPFVYNGGLGIAGTHSYTYSDSLNASACPTCGNKNLLFRFSNNPSVPAGSSQCFCDSVSVTQVVPVNIPLELGLGAFSGVAEGCSHAKLMWHTYEERGNDLRFEVQASANGKDYRTVAMVAAKGVAGSDYTQTVAMQAATTHFRLIMWADGKSTYSPMLTVKSDCWMNEVVTVYPNPFTNTVYIKGAKKDSEIVLRDITGRKLLARNAKGNEQDQLDMGRYASGTYMITVTDESGVTTTIKLSKN